MAKISPYAHGPCIVMAFKPGSLKPDAVAKAIRSCLDPARVRANIINHWLKFSPHIMDRMSREVVEGKGMPSIEIFWDDPNQPGAVTAQNCTVLYFAPRNEPKGLSVRDHDVMMLYTMVQELPVTEFEKVAYILGQMKKVVDILQPEYAVIDHFAENINKRKGRDLRQFGWGGIVFGPEMVDEVGRERILSCPQLLIKEELDWGGMWTQAWENPFITDWRLRQDMAKWLGLKELYGEKVKAE